MLGTIMHAAGPNFIPAWTLGGHAREYEYDEERQVTKPTSPLQSCRSHVPDFDILTPAP